MQLFMFERQSRYRRDSGPTIHSVIPYSAGIDFRVSKVDPRTVGVKIFLLAVDP